MLADRALSPLDSVLVRIVEHLAHHTNAGRRAAHSCRMPPKSRHQLVHQLEGAVRTLHLEQRWGG